MLTARVICWHPVQTNLSSIPDDGEDIAVLELGGTLPHSVQPVNPVLVDSLWGHPFRAYGFPYGHDNGVWASGILRDKEGTGWVQIEDIKETGYFVEQGFSGSPVWDGDADGVVGMIVATDKSSVRV